MEILKYLIRQIVLIMDNARYHCRKIEKLPPKSSRKQVLIDFLEKYDVSFPPTATKDKLYTLITNFVEKNGGRNGFETVAVEEICNSMGIELLRLPPNNCELSSIELLWSQMKRRIRAKSTPNSKIKDVVDIGREVLQSIPSEFYKNFDNHVLKLENFFYNIDGCVDVFFDPIIINLEDDSDLSESEESESEE
jgi:transposase